MQGHLNTLSQQTSNTASINSLLVPLEIFSVVARSEGKWVKKNWLKRKPIISFFPYKETIYFVPYHTPRAQHIADTQYNIVERMNNNLFHFYNTLYSCKVPLHLILYTGPSRNSAGLQGEHCYFHLQMKKLRCRELRCFALPWWSQDWALPTPGLELLLPNSSVS